MAALRSKAGHYVLPLTFIMAARRRYSARRPFCFTADVSFFLFFLFFISRQLFSELSERILLKLWHMFGSHCNLKMHVQNVGAGSPEKIGGRKTANFGASFRRRRHLMSNISGTKGDIYKRKATLQTTDIPLQRVPVWLRSAQKRRKIGV